MKFKNPLVAHIKVYVDGRTHLNFETTTEQKANHPYVIRAQEIIRKSITESGTLKSQLLPGRMYRIEITHFSLLRKRIKYTYERVC